ncbi:hypothetical protein ACFFMP_05930 [Pseudoroseomonas cervicalis]|uniref:hypothetical protein n=1 Tax=Teichococcus cervicalis TaxID=204525 RepID=UPI000318DE69|nr:hypothetical protein [Pseudoroseomonas cervicalis]
MITLRLGWRAEDQARVADADLRRGGRLGLGALRVLAQGLFFAATLLLSLRLAETLLRRMAPPAPFWRPLEWNEGVLLAAIGGVTLLLALHAQLGQRAALTRILRALPDPARQPLLGPVSVVLLPGRLSCQGQGWSFEAEAARLRQLEETPAALVLRFGPTLPALPLPRQELTEAEIQAVRAWAASGFAMAAPSPAGPA